MLKAFLMLGLDKTWQKAISLFNDKLTSLGVKVQGIAALPTPDTLFHGGNVLVVVEDKLKSLNLVAKAKLMVDDEIGRNSEILPILAGKKEKNLIENFVLAVLHFSETPNLKWKNALFMFKKKLEELNVNYVTIHGQSAPDTLFHGGNVLVVVEDKLKSLNLVAKAKLMVDDEIGRNSEILPILAGKKEKNLIENFGGWIVEI